MSREFVEEVEIGDTTPGFSARETGSSGDEGCDLGVLCEGLFSTGITGIGTELGSLGWKDARVFLLVALETDPVGVLDDVVTTNLHGYGFAGQRDRKASILQSVGLGNTSLYGESAAEWGRLKDDHAWS